MPCLRTSQPLLFAQINEILINFISMAYETFMLEILARLIESGARNSRCRWYTGPIPASGHEAANTIL